jgi:hypothetical protein
MCESLQLIESLHKADSPYNSITETPFQRPLPVNIYFMLSKDNKSFLRGRFEVGLFTVAQENGKQIHS